MAEKNNEEDKPFQFQKYSKQKNKKSRVNSQSSEDEPPDLAIDSAFESKTDDIQPSEGATNSPGKNCHPGTTNIWYFLILLETII